MRAIPDFSIIVPVYHGGDYLRNALTSLREVEFPPGRFEVLIAGANADHRSRETVGAEKRTAHYDLAYIGCGSSRRSAQLNAACSQARGRVLVFSDDDCLFLPDWLRQLDRVFQREPGAGMVGGEDELEGVQRAFGLALDYILNSPLGTGGFRRGAKSGPGAYYPRLWNMAFPREVARQVAVRTKEGSAHIFNESLTVHEDVDLAHRIRLSGKQIVFAPEVRVRHNRHATFGKFVTKNFEMGRAARRLGVHRLPHLLLAKLLIGGVTLAGLSVFFRVPGVVLLICGGIYIAILLAASIAGWRRTKRWQVLFIIPTLLVALHFTRSLGYLFPGRDRFQGEVHS